MNPEYEAVIGLEVHAQLLTDTKIFCGCSTKFGNPPNTNVCPICLGHPGVLPVLNKKVVEFAVLMGLATNCRINFDSVFARKNYFYPDLPKGYQISQYEAPICENGFVEIELKDGTKRNIGLTRIHMEEDAGKSIHDLAEATYVDVNRCGVPLIEIVSEPDMHTPEEAYEYLSRIRQTVQYLGICDGNMEEGSLRCDANVSVRLKGEKKLGTKTEVKNMNSFKNVEKALLYEIDRQIEILEDGGRIIQETLLWDAGNNIALPMRSKEEAHDYRYFPEPDLMPVAISQEWFNEIKAGLPELPKERKLRFISEFSLPVYDAEILTSSRDLADYYEKAVSVTKDYKSVSNWVMGEVLKIVNENKITVSSFSIRPENLGRLINLINDNTVSGKIAKDVFQIMLGEDKDPAVIIKERNLVQITDTSELEGVIDSVLESNPKDVKEFLSGKEKVIGFFVGQIMKETKGKANPKAVNEILRKRLNALR
ncbi:MAG: Asp-tRNA(Asn)/Glu-tRNA(Gln) amidotransferase subunit GatB [Ignavibacteria bacterium]|jgi:aspartyl-tRNA(Asn)/glutamyl-tRNA(Gln) amidotransferase subunit B|nr:Asp-tRNA(Asn)/Glu-tRNA(Gln) amidotransferase subunit GatB [Ignavibacteria bacterium]MCU7503628.1 Asp-tRNA(Asn)/Glu-tRNA(Gln) amidotransferase subunit GatB [Ignavibacteria bacterium]MCU7517889.1 Asp-tRNA(Asn)/Glu-tRNA(Gln) amidotransferase subunit GatB [Ignavibacteria bacterium]